VTGPDEVRDMAINAHEFLYAFEHIANNINGHNQLRDDPDHLMLQDRSSLVTESSGYSCGVTCATEDLFIYNHEPAYATTERSRPDDPEMTSLTSDTEHLLVPL
jgi:hypothetical protein